MGSFDGRAVLVTGGASGIGLATVRELLARGARVIAADLREAADITAVAGGGERLLALKLDVAQEAAVKAAIERAVGWAGGLYGVVNCAGINGQGQLHQVELDFWKRVFDVHVNGTFLVTRHALPHLLAAKRGAIVNVASVYGMTGGGGNISYNTAKGAILQFTRCAAADYSAAGIRVNSVSPGYIETPLTHMLDERPAAREAFIRMHPIGRAGRPEEVARAIVFLLSDDASYITAANLPVDGGFVNTANLRF
ncbi:MAG: SDR family oxidoreductase [Proteobacteria bacterium]|nr:SDR family oxidoreductase [Pseudomonadota bacterium]